MLPQDIIFDILTRLPAKSIGRFRCVSKLWRSLLSQTHFIKAHITRNKQYPVDEILILVSTISNSMYSLSLSNALHLFDESTLMETNLNVDVHPDSCAEGIPSCDGLILVKDVEERNFVVNPTTRMIKELPVCPSISRFSTTIYGLGYDSVSDDYKVVTLTSSHSKPNCDELFVDVYSLRNGTWKKAEIYKQGNGYVTFGRSGVYVSGKIYWLARRPADYSIAVLGFNLAEEEFRELTLPGGVHKFAFYQIVELGGSLCMFPSSWDETVAWVMKENDVADSWTRFTIYGDEGVEFRLVCSVGQDEVMLVQDEGTFDEKLVVYNTKENTFKDIVVRGITAELFYVGGTFVESLVSPYYSDEILGE